MNLINTQAYAKGLNMNSDRGKIIPYTLTEQKNLVITITGHLKPVWSAKRITIINDPLKQTKGWI